MSRANKRKKVQKKILFKYIRKKKLGGKIECGAFFTLLYFAMAMEGAQLSENHFPVPSTISS